MKDSYRPRIIAGYGRSGTTWLLDALAEANDLRTVFEPLHPLHVRGAREFAHRFSLASDKEESLRRFLSVFFFEPNFSLWADYRIDRMWLTPRLRMFGSIERLRRTLALLRRARQNFVQFKSRRNSKIRIVKFIRANMMLSWMKTHFDARILFLIRHPAAVVLSQMRAPHAWKPDIRIQGYCGDVRLIEHLGKRYHRLLEKQLNPAQSLTLSWCIENTIALRQANESGIPVVCYEKLLEEGDTEWARIASILDLENVPDSGIISKPSQQAWGEKAKDAMLVREYDLWMRNIADSVADDIQGILDETGFSLYRMSQALPVESAATKLQSS